MRLVIMYIEKGEDIYLTVFHKNKKIENENLTNYIFKYVNSVKMVLLKIIKEKMIF